MSTPYKYKRLGDILLERLGNERSIAWLADQTLVSRVAVSLWLSGKCRPNPRRLGNIAAILDFEEDDIPELADRAEYDDDRLYTVLQAYREWHKARERWTVEMLEQNVLVKIADCVIDLIRTDHEVRRLFRDKDPFVLDLVDQAGSHMPASVL